MHQSLQKLQALLQIAVDAEAPDQGIVDDGGGGAPMLLHFINQLHRVPDVAPLAQLIHEEGVGGGFGGGSRAGHQLHDANGLPDLVGLTEIVDELSGLGGVGPVPLPHHVLQVKEGVVEPDLLDSRFVLAVPPAGEGQGGGVLRGEGDGGRGQDPGEAIVEGERREVWEMGEEAWLTSGDGGVRGFGARVGGDGVKKGCHGLLVARFNKEDL